MLLPLGLGERRLYYDLTGPENGPVVCITHSLASDGGSDTVAGEYTMKALADDVAVVLDGLSFARVHYIGLSIGGMIGQAFALEHGDKLISTMWCDTLPASPSTAAAMWEERMSTVRRANSLEPLADATVERWFTDAFRPRNPGRWKQIRDTVAATTPAGYLGCSAAIMNFDFTGRLPSLRLPALVVCGADDPGTPASENRRLAELVPGGRYEEIPNARHFPNVERPDVFNRIMISWLEQHKPTQ